MANYAMSMKKSNDKLQKIVKPKVKLSIHKRSNKNQFEKRDVLKHKGGMFYTFCILPFSLVIMSSYLVTAMFHCLGKIIISLPDPLLIDV